MSPSEPKRSLQPVKQWISCFINASVPFVDPYLAGGTPRRCRSMTVVYTSRRVRSHPPDVNILVVSSYPPTPLRHREVRVTAGPPPAGPGTYRPDHVDQWTRRHRRRPRSVHSSRGRPLEGKYDRVRSRDPALRSGTAGGLRDQAGPNEVVVTDDRELADAIVAVARERSRHPATNRDQHA